MSPILFLIAWTTIGSALAIALAEPDEPRAGWLPYGLILGPLWLAVALDRRAGRSSAQPGPVSGTGSDRRSSAGRTERVLVGANS